MARDIITFFGQKGKQELMSWEPMDVNPPTSGHYVVGHRGRMFGTAFYNTGDVGGIPTGWSQVPDCNPSHWLNSTYDMDTVPSTFRIQCTKKPNNVYEFSKNKWETMPIFKRLKYAIRGKYWG